MIKLNELREQGNASGEGSTMMMMSNDDDQSYGIQSHDTTAQDSVMTNDFSGDGSEAMRPLNSGAKPRSPDW